MPSEMNLLQAGPVRVRYENGFLRYLSVDEVEIVRMIYFAIRNHNWQTAPFVISDETIVQNTNSFRVQYNWQIDDLGIQMVGNVAILGDASGTISVDFYGEAKNTFQKNRIGLCVLHPIDGTLGQPVRIITPENERIDSYFPTFIKPHQPFLDIQTMCWRPASGTTWQLDFEGDIFETEDQRNWTDASFKTYSTPVSIPFPVTVSPGDTYRQRVVFRIADQPVVKPPALGALDEMETLKGNVNNVAPRIGVGYWAGGAPMTDSEVSLLRQLDLSHLRVDVFFQLPGWQDLFRLAIIEANRLKLPLELTLFFNDEPAQELALLQKFLETESVRVQSILLFQAATLRTTDELLQTLVATLRSIWPDVLIGGGTDGNFVDVNRNPFDFSLVDFVSFAASPQLHASDDLTIWENIAGQAETVLSARNLTGGKPIHVAPITLTPRYVTLANSTTERLNPPFDLRHTTEFGAEWTRQSLAVLKRAGAQSLTYYLSHGPSGLVSGDNTYPVYAVLANAREESDF